MLLRLWPRRARTHWKIVTAFVALGVLVLGQIALAYRTTTNNQVASTWVEHTQEVISAANEARATVAAMESGYRGFLLTRDEVFLEPYVVGQGVYRANLAQLEQLTADNPLQVERWQTIDQMAEDWQRNVTEPTIERRRGAPRATLLPTPEIVATVASGEGKRRTDQIHLVFADAVATEQALLTRRNAEQAEANAQLQWVLVIGTLAATVIAIALAVVILRTLERERLAGVRLSIQTAEHELYNRLAAAKGNIQLIQRQPDLPRSYQRWLDRASTSIEGAVGVVQSMRDLPDLRETSWDLAKVTTVALPTHNDGR
jgi:CHASE3 domain sensor protein